MTDDDFTSRILAARPTLPRRGESLSPRAVALLNSIMDTAEDTVAVTLITTAPKRARFRLLYLSAAAALIILVVSIVLIAVPRPSPSWAITPPPLTAKPVDGTAKELMMHLTESIRAAGGTAPSVVRSQSWSLAFTPENELVPVVVAPEVREFTRHPDGSVVIDVRAGTPYDAAGNEVPDAGVQPGTVIWQLEEAPGEHVFLFPAPAPWIAAEYPAYLAAANPADTDPSAGDYFLAIRLLLDEQSLTTEQEAALVEFLATLPGINVDGEVVDRLGRTGIAFSTETRLPGQVRDTLVISPDAGVHSYEVTYLAGDRTDIQAPAVIDYAAWE